MSAPVSVPNHQLDAWRETEKLVTLAEQLQSAVGTSDFDLACHLLNQVDRLQRTLAPALLSLAGV